ncbi:MAG: TRAP transporter small permease [Proteobacteria bacterium]|nr:TRAP transporter small permease [Pseudomonadota bacterium]
MPNGTFARLQQRASRALILFAAVTLFVIMWLTVIDVVARSAFNISIVGLFEVIEIMMGILVFAGLPIVTQNEGHVAVTLLDSALGPRQRLVQKIVVNLVCATILAVFAWRLWDVAGKLADYNDITLFLKIPLAPVAYFMAVMTALSVPIQLLLLGAPHAADQANTSEAPFSGV